MQAEFRDGMPFVGGSLWLDFLNTTPVLDGRPLDFLGDEAVAQRWAAAAGLPPIADRAAARRLRDALRASLAPLGEGRPVPDDTVAAVNRVLGDAPVTRWLDAGRDHPVLAERRAGADALPAVAEDFARFVCDHQPERLRACDDPRCTIVFYDRGRNNTRRWCSMAACGNRDKVAKYRARKAAGS